MSSPEPVDNNNRKSQISVGIGIGLALGLIFGIFWLFWWGPLDYLFTIAERRLEPGDRLAYAAKWSLVPGLCLLAGIAMISSIRFFTPAINPLNDWSDKALDVWQRYTQNTLEQAVLFAIGCLAYSAITYQYWLKVIPIISVMFVVGRVLFVMGYLIEPRYRATGFALTFYPIVALYVITAGMYLLG